jgi:hypothetical protein
MIAAIVKNGVVVNRIVVDSLKDYPGAIAGEHLQIGAVFDGENYIPPAENIEEKTRQEKTTDLRKSIENDELINNLRLLNSSEFDAWFAANIADSKALQHQLLLKLLKISVLNFKS